MYHIKGTVISNLRRLAGKVIISDLSKGRRNAVRLVLVESDIMLCDSLVLGGDTACAAYAATRSLKRTRRTGHSKSSPDSINDWYREDEQCELS
jgi:hypothetical protein